MKASLEPVTGWIEELRMVKSAEEIARIRRSVETNSRAFEQAVARVRPGMKEQDLAAELEYRMRRLGAEKPAFETIVAGGARSALPHAQPTAARLEAGDWWWWTWARSQEGYCSDMTRMLFLGAPGAKVKRAYRAVLEAQLAAIDAVRGGSWRRVRVDRAARQVLKGYGLDRRVRAFHRPRSGPGDPRAAAHRQAGQDHAARRAWRSPSSPACTWRASAASASRTRWW